MIYTNSPLVTYTRISPNKTSPRNHVIDTITIHCYVGQVTAERGCNGSRFVKYNPLTGASCNYVVGHDGSIGLCVEEKDRSWCSSNKKNDHRAITIEVASETVAPYKITEKAMVALIQLCADICRRNNIKKLVWSSNKNDRVNHLNGCNMTVHRDFKNKSCPGQYLYERHGYISNEVNKLLGFDNSATTVTNSSSKSSVNYIYQGLDYSLVFNPTYYSNAYSDLKRHYSNDATKLFNHFCQYGMKEGRQASKDFNIIVYKNKYTDLQEAFGNDLSKYYEHWIKFGHKEGRSAT